jgi:cytochrome c peroxidase
LRLSLVALVATTFVGFAALPLQPVNAATVAVDGVHPGPLTRTEAFARVEALTKLGREMFVDPSLSASGAQSCSSCHDPKRAFGPPNALAVQLGGPDMDQPGVRAVPSLRYLQAAPSFTEHFYDSEDEGDESVDNGPTGGLTWDGRVDHGSDQAKIPLLSPFEMANTSVDEVATSLSKSSYADEFKAAFGADVFAHPQDAFDAAVEALGTFEQSSADFYPYSSRYDDFLAGKGTLTAQELHGRELFEDPTKGNCNSCHLSEPANDGEPPQFTDYGFLGLGVPRNASIPANADAGYHDLGLCGPQRTDFKDRPEYCGLFRTPTLRNIALRQTFFHNGEFHTLRDVVAFYATRDTDPGRWYPKNPDGSIAQYDDLPKAYWDNLNQDQPFGKQLGDEPGLTEAEIDDVVAFLGTLTDKDQLPNPPDFQKGTK